MSVSAVSITVGIEITQIVGPSVNPKVVYLQEGAGAAVVYIGGADVSALNGVVITPSSSLRIDVGADDFIYAISSLAGATVKVLTGG